MLVQINPLWRAATCRRTPPDIVDRVNELTFNASLLTQMRTIEFINSLLAAGRAARPPRCKTVRMHRVDGGEAIRTFPGVEPHLDRRRDDRRAVPHRASRRPSHWLERHFDALGQHSTVDIRRDYLDDTRAAAAPCRPSPRAVGARIPALAGAAAAPAGVS